MSGTSFAVGVLRCTLLLAAPALMPGTALCADALGASPNPLAFGNVAQGGSLAKGETVTVAAASFAFGAPKIGGTNAADFAVGANSCTGTKTTGMTCVVSVKFTPTQPPGTAETATLSLRNSAGTQAKLVGLSGTSVARTTVSPASVGFGTVYLGDTSANKSVVIRNNQRQPVGLTLTLSGPGFAMAVNGCGSSLAALASCTVQLHFTPATAATASGSLRIAVSPDAGSPYTVALSGTGSTAQVRVAPASINFGSVPAGSTSASQPVTVQNYQSTAISLGRSIGGTGFAVNSSTCGATLAAFGSCTLQLDFAPAAAGAASGTLTLTASPDSASPHAIKLSGTGMAAAVTANPILFVTQVPTAAFAHVASAFDSQQTSVDQVPRGGDLWIRYPDGTMRNLTKEAGYGQASAQDGANAIAVRQPTVDWNGQKAIFSMLVGAPAQQYQQVNYFWQLYEVTGLQEGGTAVITKLPCQPAQYNNIAPFYGSDEQVIFVSDRPRSGLASLYPQRDEYESTPTDTGLWKLNPADCSSLRIIDHAPSGVTYPSLDSSGRIVMTKWDHLVRDQQADHDVFETPTYGAFNYNSETDPSVPAAFSRAEVFPELRLKEYSLLPGQGFDGTSIAPDYPYNDFGFNHFFPWMINQDGSQEETLNHVGRHEIGGTYDVGNFRTDTALQDLQPGKYNGATYFLGGSAGMFHMREDPLTQGLYYGVQSPEFATATGGDLVRIAGAPGVDPDFMKVELLAGVTAAGGRYRNPLPLHDGKLLAAFTPNTGDLAQGGTTAAPTYNYSFRLRLLGAGYKPGSYLTGTGISKSVQYWSPDVRVSWSGLLWELDPAEVVVRAVPPRTSQPALPTPEAGIVGTNQALLQYWLQQRGLAMIVSRNVTERDRADLQQPFNLRVTGTTTQTLGAAGGTVYDVSHLQLYQADQLRGYTANGLPPQSGGSPTPGRRNLAEPMHDPAAVAAMGTLLDGSAQTPIAADGSVAAFVPAGRAMTWELVDAGKTGWDRGIVRERNWLSFKPGELRVCTNCHGINTYDQAGHTAPTNAPQALSGLMQQWVKVVRNNCPASGGTGTWSYNGVPFSSDREGQQYRIQTCQGGACCDGLPAVQAQPGP
ncbi:MAG: choice-of-anchor D domain-containing protein [Nevskia sp.]|nr:choice-of-anchor D domain-containing protein [Nevskia sp.]